MYRYRFLITALALTALTILLTVASSPAQAAPRSIPWDCSDWQETPAVADADDARVSMILESLAANRGKSIYCAIDQSDTWTKAETWAAGRDRNERDDTVYFGESGNFRGFLAAQEGYLTDGESGVTGVSRELIFEFPREERRRRYVWKKRPLSEVFQYGFHADMVVGASDSVEATAQSNADSAYVAWVNTLGGSGEAWFNDWVDNLRPRIAADARAKCREMGYSATPRDIELGTGRYYYSPDQDGGADFAFIASVERPYTATCRKRVRR